MPRYCAPSIDTLVLDHDCSLFTSGHNLKTLSPEQLDMLQTVRFLTIPYIQAGDWMHDNLNAMDNDRGMSGLVRTETEIREGNLMWYFRALEKLTLLVDVHRASNEEIGPEITHADGIWKVRKGVPVLMGHIAEKNEWLVKPEVLV